MLGLVSGTEAKDELESDFNHRELTVGVFRKPHTMQMTLYDEGHHCKGMNKLNCDSEWKPA